MSSSRSGREEEGAPLARRRGLRAPLSSWREGGRQGPGVRGRGGRQTPTARSPRGDGGSTRATPPQSGSSPLFTLGLSHR